MLDLNNMVLTLKPRIDIPTNCCLNVLSYIRESKITTLDELKGALSENIDRNREEEDWWSIEE